MRITTLTVALLFLVAACSSSGSGAEPAPSDTNPAATSDTAAPEMSAPDTAPSSPAPAEGDDYAATITVVVDGETYTDTLSGPEEVACYMVGDVEEGFLEIELQGPKLYLSSTDVESGVDRGAHEADAFVDAADPDVADQVSVLQDITATFVIEEAHQVDGDDWFFSGRVTGTSPQDATPATVEATFSCVGPVNT